MQVREGHSRVKRHLVAMSVVFTKTVTRKWYYSSNIRLTSVLCRRLDECELLSPCQSPQIGILTISLKFWTDWIMQSYNNFLSVANNTIIMAMACLILQHHWSVNIIHNSVKMNLLNLQGVAGVALMKIKVTTLSRNMLADWIIDNWRMILKHLKWTFKYMIKRSLWSHSNMQFQAVPFQPDTHFWNTGGDNLIHSP